VAVENMANAIKKISVARGYDVTRYALACFGGAGGQHACMIADRLGMERVHIHPLSGVLSAYGMGLADIRAIRTQAAVLPLRAESLPELEAIRARLADVVFADVAGQGVPAGEITASPRAHLRYEGTDTAIRLTSTPTPKGCAGFRSGAPEPVRLRVRGQGDRRGALEVVPRAAARQLTNPICR
jgi:5-oxoprolinase (ATP-hydrolysing)